ncbi:DMT family transporter [Pseudothauera rhizosphaerae]|uniref:EamA family transporter n=1 Tax=Pseudothauera rhizosphaerae TaxID=2565932 RepID=A0A4S4AUQ7_9RHOO|nr:EamA family transporter [Pseudothauera rhizosphaerae]THF63524.1 EamA family transporter [Pseudothauera rhizosphaerae]
MASITQVEPVNARPAETSLVDRIVVAILFSIVCLTWGTTWLGIKLAVQTVPPILASGLRFLVAFPLLLLIARALRASLLFPRGQGGLFALIVVCYFALPYLLINAGEQHVTSGLAALLFSTMPVFTLIFSALILREQIWGTQIVGIVVGFFSLVMILHEQGVGLAYRSIFGAAAILLAAVFHAFCYVVTKKRGTEIGIVTFNTLPIGIAGVALTVVGILVERPDVSQFSATSAGALVYLGTIASVGGFLAYFYLLKRLSPLVLSFVFLIFPVIAVVLSAWLEQRGTSLAFAGYCALLLSAFGLTKLHLGLLSLKRA